VNQRARAIALGIVCFALGVAVQRAYDAVRVTRSQVAKTVQVSTPPAAAVQAVEPVWTADNVERSSIDHSKQPLWAWGETEPPKPDEKQAVQFPPGAASAANQNVNLISEELNLKQHVEDSRIELSLAEIRGAANGARGAVDWFPEDHPNPMPDVIKYGPAALGKEARACGSCHLSDGSGRPENASPAGLPAGYIVRQLNDFKNGLRHSADPRKANSNTMVMLAKALTDKERRQAAEYFSAVKWRPHVRVIETNLVPKTEIQGELFIPTARERTEPIGGRIIEVPTNIQASQTLRSSRGTWIAYVPVGAIEKGKALVTLGAMKIVKGRIVEGKTTACGTCHGVDLMGVPPDVPPLAGRSPSYLAREIFDIQQGSRRGSDSSVQLMKMVVEKLQPDDILNITAYLASRPIPGTPNERLVTRR
jgi:cytochrome c553